MDDNPVQVIQGKWIVIEKNLGREDGIGTKMPPAETKIKQTMLHPRSKTHYKIKCLVVQVMLNKDHPFKDKIEKS